MEGGHAVGAVSRLWRYPVKSMLGEEVDSGDLVWSGFYGNRRYALMDVESSRLVSAKNPAKWARMFECRSRLIEEGGSGAAPWVQVILPGGERFEIAEGSYGGAEAALSRLLRRQVRFVAARAEPREISMEQYHPEIEEDVEAGRTTEFQRSDDAQQGTFTDMAAVHLVTTASLRALAALHPAGSFDPLRFRPDLLVDTGMTEGFVESGWMGRTLEIGEARLRVYRECGRCVMTTLSQGELASDTQVLRTAMRFNRGKVGVYASVLRGGTVRKSDRVALA